MNNLDLIAYLAAFFTMIGYIPQAIKTIKTKDTKAISFWMYFCTTLGVVLWLVFAIMINNIPMILKNITVIILGGIVLWIKTVHIFKNDEEKIIKTTPIKKLKKFFKKS
jgi:MtN3 and saliva related transmembrane protein